MSATTAPTVALNVTESAANEIRKFMSGEEGLPETSGLRVRVVPGGCSGFQYSLNIEEQSREGDSGVTLNRDLWPRVRGAESIVERQAVFLQSSAHPGIKFTVSLPSGALTVPCDGRQIGTFQPLNAS